MRVLLALVLLAATPVAWAACDGDQIAPDRGTVARVVVLNKHHEASIGFYSADGRLLAKQDYASPDMEHGLVIGRCAWTPDSKFFVFSTYSSGGHQAWHFGTKFYVRATGKVMNLDDLVGPITDPDFTVSEPDLVHTTGRSKTTQDEMKLDVSLSKLLDAQTSHAKQQLE